MELPVLDLHLDEMRVDRVKSCRGPHKLSTSENIVCNEHNRMAKENIDKRVNILENKTKIIHVHVLCNLFGITGEYMLQVRSLISKNMTKKYHNHRLHINTRHHEKETQNTASHVTIKVKQLVTLN